MLVWEHLRSCTPKRRLHVHTGHSHNIFDATFFPNSDTTMVTCAADREVRVHRIGESGEVDTKCYRCHRGRTKKIATSRNAPSVAWTSDEAGTVRQLDIRTPHRCGSEDCTNTILLDLGRECGRCGAAGRRGATFRRPPGIKSVEVCPVASEYLLVGASDPYVRIFDRRMIGRG